MTAKRLVTIIAAIGLFPPGANSQVNLNQGLIAYYPFNGNANDATGNGNNGIPMNGVQLTTDRFGNPNSAYFFDGIDDYIVVNDNGKLSPKSITVAAYVNTEITTGQSIAGKIEYTTGYAATYNLGTNYDIQTGFYFGVVPNNGTCFQQYPYDPNLPFAKSQGVFSTNVWHCVVGTFENSVLKIYVDGVLIDTKSSPTPGLLQCSNTQFLIGSWWAQDPILFKGKIDDVRVYDRALNQDEVTALCSLGACPVLQGTLTGSNICSGNTQGFLTFHSPNNSGPFTLTYTDGTNTYTQTNVQDSVPFAIQSGPLATTTYTLLSITDASNCSTPVSGITAKISVGTCSLCTGSLGDPVVNVTFGSGANPGQPLSTIVPGASTTLQYVGVNGNPATPTPLDGQYTITNNVPANADWFSGAANHTPNDQSGYMAFYNSSELPGEFYEQKVSNLCSSTTYQFAAWIANALNPALVSGINPDITFIIQQTDGTVLGVYDTGPVAQQSSFTWIQYGFFFTAPPGVSTVVLKMINNSPGGTANLGNDLAIDDITFRPCGPTSTASFTTASLLDSIAICEKTDTIIYGQLSNGYASPGYLWQVSVDSGATWTDIPGSNSLQLPITPPVTGSTKIYKYRLLTAESANIGSVNCRAVSNLVTLTVLNVPIPDFSFTESVCDPLQAQFSGLGLSGTAYNWLIDGSSYSGQNISTVFSQFGLYPIKLTSTSSGGCRDSITKNVSIQMQPADIIVSKDTTVCIGKSLVIRTHQALDFCWLPSSYLDNPLLAAPTATPPVTTKYYFTAKIAGNNLITNGDFSNGNTSFSSAYIYDPTNMTEGEYFVGKNPGAWNPGFPTNCGDHTSGTGNMLMINGSPAASANVWTQQVAVTPNTQYIFATWIESLLSQSTATLQFYINGIPFGNPINAPSTGCVWQPFTNTWNSGNNSTALISLTDLNIARTGNDFALDDMSFASIVVQRDSITVSVESPSVTGFPDTTICPGTQAPLHASGAASYSWTPASGLSNPAIPNPVASPPTTTSFIVTGTSSAGCIAKDTVLVSVFPLTVVILTPDTNICQGDAVQLQAKGGLNYSWTPAQSLDNPGIANPLATPSVTTRLFLKATDLNNCQESDSMTITIRPIPVFHAPGNEQVCQGFAVKLVSNNDSRYIYEWSPATALDDPASPSPLASPGVNTVYALHISDSVCTDYDSIFHVSVQVNPTPVIVAEKANDIDCSMATSQLSANGARSYAWTPATGLSDPRASAPVASIDSTTTFIVRGTDNKGCSGYDTVTVKVTDAGNNRFVVPNAFSPNGDGHNDCFGIRRWGDVKVKEFSVFNRWGVRVFTTKNPSECWDGNFRGHPQAAGAYPYVIKASSFCGEITRTGTVILVR